MNPLHELPLCVLVATGGTIAMRVDAARGAPVPAVSGAGILACAPDIAGFARIEVQDLFNLPSGHMDPPRWMQLHDAVAAALARPEVAGVAVTHGTDTLEESAWFLDLALESDKPVVLTGAQRNASERDGDGPRNLLQAVRLAVSPEARGIGAVIVFNDRIHAARHATKAHTANVDAFSSGERGALGRIDGGDITLFHAAPPAPRLPLTGAPLPRVDIVPMYAGSDAALIDAAIAAGARGIVVDAFGMGNVNVALYEGIRAAIARGVAVAVATRVAAGGTHAHYGNVGGGRTLRDAGAIFAGELPSHKARILLMLALQRGLPASDVQALFDFR